MSLVQHICKFFALDVMFRTSSFICLRLFCHISSFYAFLRLFNFTREPRINCKSAAGKVGLTLHGSTPVVAYRVILDASTADCSVAKFSGG